MHSERYRVAAEAWRPSRPRTGWSPSAPRRVRALEQRRARASSPGRTDLFIRRPFHWQVVDVLLTNFHLPARAAHDDRRLRRAALARPVRRSRWRTATASSPSATPCCWRAGGGATPWLRSRSDATDGRGAARRRRHGPRHVPHAVLHAGRHPRARSSCLTRRRLERLGAEIVLGNTYHLMLRPGADDVAALGGSPASRAGRASLTDSGGFQVFSLEPEVDDDGVTFRSTYDGSMHRLTPESAVALQELLGADIQMVLDVCLPCRRRRRLRSPSSAPRRGPSGPAAHRRAADQALFGIVQGGDRRGAARECAQRTVALDFDGYGIGRPLGGRDPRRDAPGARRGPRRAPGRPAALPHGRRRPARDVEAVALGVDQFDCVLPTRLGRHGTL